MMTTRSKHYTPHTKMADLVSDHYKILLLIYRFDIPLGMGEKTIKEMCEEYDVDVDTFLFIVHFLLFGEGTGQQELHKKLSLPLIIRFLRNSHSYFLDYRLPEIKRNMMEAISEAPQDIQFVINKYFDEYEEEVYQHMKYENEVVFPYAQALMEGAKDPEYGISTFEQKHDQVELKMLELKNIFIKYYPMATDYKVNNILHDLFTCSDELHNHNDVEDFIFVKIVKELEREVR
ncbi:hemerythrin domain-containing protein [Porphyromonas levii]|uniref:Hemerythrin domain-containing protein n=1 Tax=Porphyromonas levii TaxID=28114 RepID=A0A4Y8WQC6_9PORP|nr:hemerythrin domain-containing protein [Porphyromonas levii]MBR8712751.1 hypothetical protein [Porphyromonas levii]MBR8714752.1 hypothetical protein [Porphyromonas levii]MBR8727284.1 hypothetical protein [Porphyromonas levii]MBR8782390.1 hypothetical protein [Porphyromonas levii]TFH94716.1 hemerythrin domain-containing protein [Porphyromonas levii]